MDESRGKGAEMADGGELQWGFSVRENVMPSASSSSPSFSRPLSLPQLQGRGEKDREIEWSMGQKLSVHQQNSVAARGSAARLMAGTSLTRRFGL